MKKMLFLTLLLTLTTPLLASEKSADAPQSTFDVVLHHYEVVRVELLNDRMPNVAEHGEAIRKALADLQESWSAEQAGIDPAKAAEVREALPKIAEAAAALAKTSDLDAAREAFYGVSQPLVRYWEAAAQTASRGVVAFCPMVNKSWLQPKGEIGNPYHGQSMAACGSVVAE